MELWPEMDLSLEAGAHQVGARHLMLGVTLTKTPDYALI